MKHMWIASLGVACLCSVNTAFADEDQPDARPTNGIEDIIVTAQISLQASRRTRALSAGHAPGREILADELSLSRQGPNPVLRRMAGCEPCQRPRQKGQGPRTDQGRLRPEPAKKARPRAPSLVGTIYGADKMFGIEPSLARGEEMADNPH